MRGRECCSRRGPVGPVEHSCTTVDDCAFYKADCLVGVARPSCAKLFYVNKAATSALDTLNTALESCVQSSTDANSDRCSECEIDFDFPLVCNAGTCDVGSQPSSD